MSETRSQRVLITGASGLLGSTLVNSLPTNWSVAALFHSQVFSVPQSVNVLRGDLTKQEPDILFGGIKDIDTIIHTAAFTNVDKAEIERAEAYALNTEVPLQLAIFCKKRNIHLIHISTDHIFDGKKGMYTEEDAPAPLNYYAETKWQAEKKIQQIGGQHTIVRTNFFGFNVQKKHDIAGWMLESLRNREPRTLFSDVFFSPIFAPTLAAALVEIAAQKLFGTLHVAATDNCSKFEYGLKLASAFSLDSSIFRPGLIDESTLTVKRPKNMSLDTSKATALLKTSLGTVDASVERYREYYLKKIKKD